jgi:hypothetical protein
MTLIVMALGLLTAFAITLKLGAPRPQPVAIRKD